MSRLLDSLLTADQRRSVVITDAQATAFASLRRAQAAHPRLALQPDRQPLATASLPCVSDADPAEGDVDEDTDPLGASEIATELTGRADRAWQSCRADQRMAAADLYRQAAAALIDAANMCEAGE